MQQCQAVLPAGAALDLLQQHRVGNLPLLPLLLLLGTCLVLGVSGALLLPLLRACLLWVLCRC